MFDRLAVLQANPSFLPCAWWRGQRGVCKPGLHGVRAQIVVGPCPVGSNDEEKLWWKPGELWRETCEEPAGWTHPWSSPAALRR